MAARQGVRRGQREHDDFVGDPFLRLRREAAEQAAMRRRWLRDQAVNLSPPSVEDAVLMAVAEQIDDRKIGRWELSRRGGHMKWVEEPFDWRLPHHWANRDFAQCREVAAAALMELTPFTAVDIADMLGCTPPTVAGAHKRYRGFLAKQKLRFGEQLRLDELIRIMERTEEIADCALIWIDGVEVRE